MLNVLLHAASEEADKVADVGKATETGKNIDDKWLSNCLEHNEPHSPTDQS